MSRKAAWVDEKSVESWMAESFLSVRAAARFVTKSFEVIRLRASRLRRDTGFIVPHDPFFSRKAAFQRGIFTHR
jgi:hypothetical protein